MKKLLNTEETFIELNKLLRQAQSEILILSAFLTYDITQLIDNGNFTSFQNIKLCVRGRPEDVIRGACNLNLIKKFMKLGIECYFSDNLHAKITVIDYKIAVVGSSNTTNNGLGLNAVSNFEFNSTIDLSKNDYLKVKNFYSTCIRYNDYIIEEIERQLQQFLSMPKGIDIPKKWANINYGSNYEQLFLSDFPKFNNKIHDTNSSEYLHDVYWFGIGNDTEKFRVIFIQSKLFNIIESLLKDSIDKQMYFGKLTEVLHNLVVDDFVSRKDIKFGLQKFIEYLNLVSPTTILVDRPNYSQRFYLADK